MSLFLKNRRRIPGIVSLALLASVCVASSSCGNVVKKIKDKGNAKKFSEARTQVRLLDDCMQQYRLDVGDYPSALQCLVENLDQSEKWNGPYIKKVPLDPWGAEYQYLFPGEHGEFDLWSYGADGLEGGEGINADITNWWD